jgi:hypothetical protein
MLWYDFDEIFDRPLCNNAVVVDKNQVIAPSHPRPEFLAQDTVIETNFNPSKSPNKLEAS